MKKQLNWQEFKTNFVDEFCPDTFSNLGECIDHMCAEIRIQVFWEELHGCWAVLCPVRVVAHTHVTVGRHHSGKRNQQSDSNLKIDYVFKFEDTGTDIQIYKQYVFLGSINDLRPAKDL